MKRHSEKELQAKMHTFMMRKTQKYPELLPMQKGYWTTVHARTISSRLFMSTRGLNAQVSA